MSAFRLLHLSAFVVPFAVYTVLLLVPHPLPTMPTMDIDFMFFVSKGAHAGGYAYLAAVGFLYPRAPRWRWAVVGFLMLHGIGTEIGQTYVPNRHGCIQDVLIDWSGIAVGQFAARRFLRWAAPEKRPAAPLPDSQSPAAGPE